MSILQIGAGGVGWAVAHKAAQHNDVFGDITIASRSPGRIAKIIESIHRKRNLKDPTRSLTARTVDTNDLPALVKLIEEFRPTLVINAGPPWVNANIMEACVCTHTPYLDTSVGADLCSPGQQPPDCYDAQWAFRERFAQAKLTGIMGAGFDPGVVSVFAAHAKKHLFDTIHTIDVLDVNAGNHGRKFATNFDPEANLLEIQGDSFYWEEGAWKRVPCHSRMIEFNFPEVGPFQLYSMAHEEVRSLVEHIPARRIEFWMGFGENYLRYFNVLRDVGMLSPTPVTTAEGVTVAPLKVLKAVLPEPTSLAKDYKGKTCIGTLVSGSQGGQPRRVFLYNVCDHEVAYADIESQAISYTVGVPAITAALLFFRGVWSEPGLWNIEQLNPDPFLELMPSVGLGWASTDVRDADAPVPRMVTK